MQMIRSGQWDAAAVIEGMAPTTLRTLPPPADGVLYLIGDSTLQAKRGRQHPLGHTKRQSEYGPYMFGCEMVLLIASWEHVRVPIAVALIDPQCRWHQNTLCRHMLQDVVPLSWVRQVMVIADAGCAANATMRLIAEKQYDYVLALPRTRKFTNGKHLRDMVQHLPKSCYYRRASDKPDGRRQDYWVFLRHATLHNLGDVTMVLSKQRRNSGPKNVQSLVTNLTDVHAGAVLSIDARRWGIALTRKRAEERVAPGPEASDQGQRACDALGRFVRCGLSALGPAVWE